MIGGERRRAMEADRGLLKRIIDKKFRNKHIFLSDKNKLSDRNWNFL